MLPSKRYETQPEQLKNIQGQPFRVAELEQRPCELTRAIPLHGYTRPY
jgi:hypothetical protein